MHTLQPADFARLYAGFDPPIAALNCGEKCAPHNEHGVPFCCDTRHAVPSAYNAEWAYLQANTDLWHVWQAEDPAETASLNAEKPDGQTLIACLGHTLCQRGFRSLTCRAFPFFPYVDAQGDFLGLSYYWEYQDRCWVVSHLSVVTDDYRQAFVRTYDELFERQPGEREAFQYHAQEMRAEFSRRRRRITLLHRNGGMYQILPRTAEMRPVNPDALPKFGVYQVAASLPFPDEE